MLMLRVMDRASRKKYCDAQHSELPRGSLIEFTEVEAGRPSLPSRALSVRLQVRAALERARAPDNATR